MPDEIYQPKNIPIFEAIYGRGLISLGGYPAVDNMLKNLDITDKKLLDVGSGIGGMAHYIAQRYNAGVTGLEIRPWMAEHALQQASDDIKDRVNFVIYNPDGTTPLPSEQYDVIYSKGVLTNISNKPILLAELYRLLKPRGYLCLIDWLVPESQGPKYEILPMGDASYKETTNSYQKILTQAGFTNISFQDNSDEYLEYVKLLDTKLQSKEHKTQFKSIINNELRQELINSNHKLQLSIESHQQMSYLIRACKS
tara:strand:+ start:72295 stop:73056 length:762 start_codon:yes stop_codon:yes gene_type:complete